MLRRLFITAIMLPFLAAASPASHPPLFVPPKGMVRVANPPFMKYARPRPGERLEASYRGTTHETFGGRTYNDPVYLNIVSLPSTFTPAEAGMIQMSRVVNRPHYDIATLQNRARSSCLAHTASPKWCANIRVTEPTRFDKKLVSREVRLCNGRSGWFDEYQSPSGDEVHADVFARGGNRIYEASYDYSSPTGDVFHAVPSLNKLCPPVESAPDAAAVLPVALGAPGMWYRATPPKGDNVMADAAWMRLGPKTTSLEMFAAFSASDTDEYIAPQQEAAAFKESLNYYGNLKVVESHAQSYCGQDGWKTVAHGNVQGYPYVIETLTGYANDSSYMFMYSRRADESDDPYARRVLNGFCPSKLAAAQPTSQQ